MSVRVAEFRLRVDAPEDAHVTLEVEDAISAAANAAESAFQEALPEGFAGKLDEEWEA